MISQFQFERHNEEEWRCHIALEYSSADWEWVIPDILSVEAADGREGHPKLNGR